MAISSSSSQLELSYEEKHCRPKAFLAQCDTTSSSSMRSDLVNAKQPSCIVSFDQNEIRMGKRIGSGAYSNVYEIDAFDIQRFANIVENEVKPEEGGDDSNGGGLRDEVSRDEQMKRECMSLFPGNYVVKMLKPELKRDPEYAEYLRDLANEARMLSKLNHPNIIKLHGVSSSLFSSRDDFANGESEFFLVLEKLDETLDDRIEEWRSSRISKSPKSSKLKSNFVSQEQFQVAASIASALDYLHQQNIILRDLKPDNIGFDSRGNVKLFDFGLARKLPSSPSSSNNMMTKAFKMSGGVGTPRYTAPEVLSNDSYNLKADVYSFSCVLWEILTLEPPYSEYRDEIEFMYALTMKDARPKINPKWPKSIRTCISGAFSEALEKRPSMNEFYGMIQKCCEGMREDETKKREYSFSRKNSMELKSKTILLAKKCSFSKGQVLMRRLTQ